MSLPRIDLHRHLDGNVRLETILDLGRQHNIALPGDDLESLRPHVQIVEPEPSLMAFIGKFKWMTAVMVDLDAVRRIAFENIQDAAQENLDYVELRFSPWFMAETHGLSPSAVIEAVVDGVEAGRREFGVPYGLIGIISRTYGPETGMKELDALLEHKDHLVALDLAGDEINFPGELFREHFRRGRDAGWRITVHAGEAAGPESVWQALKELGAERIGHGFRAIEDPGLIEYLASSGIGLEISLTSNLHTSSVESYKSHPAVELLRSGVRVCLNTDDPGISGINLEHELGVAAPAAGFTPAEIDDCKRKSLEMAFMGDVEKLRLMARG